MKFDLENIKTFYASLLKKYGHDHPMALHWTSKNTQELRFLVLALIDELNGHSILDVGCGVGDLYGFFQREKIKVDYTGWDISSEMVAAAREKYPNGKFEVVDILDEETSHHLPLTPYHLPFKQFDYVFASGTMNVAIADHERWVLRLIARMYSCAKVGVGFNLLSSASPDKDHTFYYAEPERILAACRQLTPNVVLRHDYLPGDLTMFLYRSISR